MAMKTLDNLKSVWYNTYQDEGNTDTSSFVVLLT